MLASSKVLRRSPPGGPPFTGRASRLVGLALGLVALTATGCGPNCYSACSKLYQEECHISAAGQTENDLMTECVQTCQDALTTPGEVGSYDPDQPQASTNAITIDNDRQAALWMDCVDQASCENIEGDSNGDGQTDGPKMCLPHF